eukprot:6331170-Karenia_brevis.AAC.1
MQLLGRLGIIIIIIIIITIIITIIFASPVLFDAGAQTDISILKSLPNKFFVIDEAGHASPVSVDGDFAAGVDMISFNAAISTCERDSEDKVGTQCELLPQPVSASPPFDAVATEVASTSTKDFNSLAFAPHGAAGGASLASPVLFGCESGSQAGHAMPVLFDAIDVIADKSQNLTHTACGPLPQHAHASLSHP